MLAVSFDNMLMLRSELVSTVPKWPIKSVIAGLPKVFLVPKPNHTVLCMSTTHPDQLLMTKVHVAIYVSFQNIIGSN